MTREELAAAVFAAEKMAGAASEVAQVATVHAMAAESVAHEARVTYANAYPVDPAAPSACDGTIPGCKCMRWHNPELEQPIP